MILASAPAPLVGVIALLVGIFVGLLIAPVQRPEKPPTRVGDFATAADLKRLNERLGCGHLYVRDGDLLQDAMRDLRRCLRARRAVE
jgi:hypothetical protein